jgi:hypothetical protein
MRKAMNNILKIWLLLFLLLTAPGASAITITTSFVGGTAPKNTSGGGNIIEIFNAAARIWEKAYDDSFTLHLYFGWDTLDSAGTHATLEQSGPFNRETTGIILFDNSENVSFYLDPTPSENDEYQRFSQESQDLGAGFINVARLYHNPTGNAVGHCDLLSVALHEIGHALGMSLANATFARDSEDGFLQVVDPNPFAGTAIPLSQNNAGFTSHFDPMQIAYGSVMSGICSDERRMPSALDVIAIAQVAGFQFPNLNSRLVSAISIFDPAAIKRAVLSSSNGRSEP